MINTSELRKAGKAIFIAVEETVAQDISDKLITAANEIDELQDFAIWMTGCGYDFCQHEYYLKKRTKLLKYNHRIHSDGEKECECPVQGFTVFHKPECKYYE